MHGIKIFLNCRAVCTYDKYLKRFNQDVSIINDFMNDNFITIYLCKFLQGFCECFAKL